MLLSPFTVASIIPFHATVLKMGGDIEIECQSLQVLLKLLLVIIQKAG
jgi:hypothetical protein